MSWEERFEARFSNWSVNHYRESLIKDFIREEIDEAEKRGAREGFETGYEKGHNDTVESRYSPEVSLEDYMSEFDDVLKRLESPKASDDT